MVSVAKPTQIISKGTHTINYTILNRVLFSTTQQNWQA